jgi:hypothetical protein
MDTGFQHDAENETILGAEKSRDPRRSAFDDKYRIYHTLNEAASEITHLRATVERLKPRAEAYDRVCQILDMSNNGRLNAWGVDRNWEIRELTERMKSELNETHEEPGEENGARMEAGQEDFGDAREDARAANHARNRERSTAADDLAGAGVRIATEREPGT